MTRQDDKLANLRNVAGEVIHHLEAGKVMVPFTTQAIAGSTKVAINSDTLRHYKNGATIWIPPTIVGHHRMGTIVHDYLV